MEGNQMKMREALENSNGLLEELAAIGEWGESAREQIAENKAALSKPPRNCDVGTPDEQESRFEEWCHAHKSGHSCRDCTLDLSINTCALEWAQMPYEAEGEGDD